MKNTLYLEAGVLQQQKTTLLRTGNLGYSLQGLTKIGP